MTKQEVFDKLEAKRTNCRQFALVYGYDPRTVPKVITRYANTRRVPRGVQTCAILRDLSAVIGEPVIDGLEAIIQRLSV
jgi:hypothetical protein